MGWRPVGEADLALYRESPDSISYIIEVDGKPIGTCGLYLIQWRARRAQFNILIGEPESWGKGYGTEALRLLLDHAFNVLNLNSVNLGVNAENKGAIRSYEKAGFSRDGVRPEFIYRNGRYYDLVVMTILREQFGKAAGT